MSRDWSQSLHRTFFTWSGRYVAMFVSGNRVTTVFTDISTQSNSSIPPTKCPTAVLKQRRICFSNWYIAIERTRGCHANKSVLRWEILLKSVIRCMNKAVKSTPYALERQTTAGYKFDILNGWLVYQTSGQLLSRFPESAMPCHFKSSSRTALPP